MKYSWLYDVVDMKNASPAADGSFYCSVEGDLITAGQIDTHSTLYCGHRFWSHFKKVVVRRIQQLLLLGRLWRHAEHRVVIIHRL